MEAPESWFEDFGKGQLVNGKATVTLDPEFAALVHGDDYHVFVTTYGASQGLDIMSQSPGGFSVQERNNGASNIAFGWRLVAKRADVKAERLAKFEMPHLTVPEPLVKSTKPAPPTPADGSGGSPNPLPNPAPRNLSPAPNGSTPANASQSGSPDLLPPRRP